MGDWNHALSFALMILQCSAKCLLKQKLPCEQNRSPWITLAYVPSYSLARYLRKFLEWIGWNWVPRDRFGDMAGLACLMNFLIEDKGFSPEFQSAKEERKPFCRDAHCVESSFEETIRATTLCIYQNWFVILIKCLFIHKHIYLKGKSLLSICLYYSEFHL